MAYRISARLRFQNNGRRCGEVKQGERQEERREMRARRGMQISITHLLTRLFLFLSPSIYLLISLSFSFLFFFFIFLSLSSSRRFCDIARTEDSIRFGVHSTEIDFPASDSPNRRRVTSRVRQRKTLYHRGYKIAGRVSISKGRKRVSKRGGGKTNASVRF